MFGNFVIKLVVDGSQFVGTINYALFEFALGGFEVGLSSLVV